MCSRGLDRSGRAEKGWARAERGRIHNDRQTNSFIEKNSIEAGILLGGNGILHAMLVARCFFVRSLPGTNHS